MNYFSLILSVFRDMLADKTRKQISQHHVLVSCINLASNIQQKYDPNLVVAIDAGGSVPGELIAHHLRIPIEHFVIRRSICIARRYSLDPIPLRWIMSFYHHLLFQTTKPVLSVGSSIDVSGRKVVIIDDVMHTGATIDVAVSYLEQAHVSEIKIATLAFISVRKPDFFALPSGNYSFPWSRDYRRVEV